ncbi:hypothetical protein LOZ64_001042 [Ophidiomyces ophidiicola]|nr:hypothetical protein LOZ64_001042 [Ophidiomyces ophidiicola]
MFLQLIRDIHTVLDTTDSDAVQAVVLNLQIKSSTEHFMKTDKLNELLNLKLKKLLQSQRTSTFKIQKLFQKSIYILKYIHQLHQAVEQAYEKYTDAKHIKKSVSEDICSLASLISEQLCVSVESNSEFLLNMKLSEVFQNLFFHVATVNTYIVKVLETGGVGVGEENNKDLNEVDLCREDAVEIDYSINYLL